MKKALIFALVIGLIAGSMAAPATAKKKKKKKPAKIERTVEVPYTFPSAVGAGAREVVWDVRPSRRARARSTPLSRSSMTRSRPEPWSSAGTRMATGSMTLVSPSAERRMARWRSPRQPRSLPSHGRSIFQAARVAAPRRDHQSHVLEHALGAR